MPNHFRRLACCLLVASGCASTTQGEKVRNAQMERVDERANTDQNSIERREDARNDAVEQRYDNKERRVEASNQPGENASEELVGVSKERAQYQSDAQARVEKLANRISVADKKIQILGARAPSRLKTELQTAAKQYDQIKEEVNQLPKTPADHWEHATKKLEQSEEGLDARMTKLEGSMDDR